MTETSSCLSGVTISQNPLFVIFFIKFSFLITFELLIIKGAIYGS